jgi:hypothetical protein
MATRTYKRDANGRFAGGGGGGGGKGRGGAKPAKAAKASKPAKASKGRPKGASGGKTGSSMKQKKAAAEQAARSAQFKGKAPVSKAKATYKAAKSKMREIAMLAGGNPSAKGVKGRTDAYSQRKREDAKAYSAAKARVKQLEKTRGAKGRKKR